MLDLNLWYNIVAWEQMPAAAYLATLTGGRKVAHTDAARRRPILQTADEHSVIYRAQKC
jgi:hypothetical protein